MKDWLASYKPLELFDPSASDIIRPEVTAILPKDNLKRLGQTKVSYDNHQPLNCADWMEFASKKNDQASPMKAVGRYLTDVIEKNVSRGPPEDELSLIFGVAAQDIPHLLA